MRAGEVAINELLRETHRVKNLRAAVGLIRGDAHLGHHLQQPLVDGLDEALARLVAIDLLGEVLRHRREAVEHQPRVDSLRAIAREAGEVMHLTRLTGLDHETNGRAQTLADQVMMHSRSGEQRRDRNAIRPHKTVGQHDDVVAAAHRVLCALAQAVEHGLHALRAALGRIGDVERLRVEGILEVPDDADLLEVLIGEDRLADLKALALRVAFQIEDVRAWADERHEAHHELFADRIDRRVRHLREVLLEVGVKQLRLAGERRQRRVRAHGADRFLARDRHGREEHRHVFLRVAERLLAIEQGHVRARGARLDGLHVLKHHLRALEPLAVGMRGRQRALHLVVGDDAAFLQIDEQHLARLETPLLDDLLFRNRQHADFRSHDDEIVVGDDVARGAQAVTVQRGANLATVREGHGRRAVPRLHQRGMILVEGAALLIHQRVASPRLGDEHHHRVSERIAALHEELERVVETGRVRLALVGDGPQLGDVVAEQLRLDGRLTGRHPVHVAAQRVDFTVVRNHAVGVRKTPGREGVRGEALMHQRERALESRIAEILVVGAKLGNEHHALVDDGAAGHGDRIILCGLAATQRLDGVGGGLAGDVKPTLEVVLIRHARAAADERLTHGRLDSFHRVAEIGIVDGSVAPAQKGEPLLAQHATNDRLNLSAGAGVARHEELTDAVKARRREGEPEPGALLREERMRHLHENAAAVTELGISAHRAAMVEVEQDLQALLHNLVALAVLHVGDEADAAGIALERGVEEAAGFRQGRVVDAGH